MIKIFLKNIKIEIKEGGKGKVPSLTDSSLVERGVLGKLLSSGLSPLFFPRARSPHRGAQTGKSRAFTTPPPLPSLNGDTAGGFLFFMIFGEQQDLEKYKNLGVLNPRLASLTGS